MIQNFNFTRAGDVWSWYYNEHFERLPYQSPLTPRVERAIAREMISFEKEILSNITGTDSHIGLSDFVSLMAQPDKVWGSQLDFPRLYSISRSAQEELFELFHYDETLTIRNQQELDPPDFENFSLPSLCTGAESEDVEYCRIIENLPDLKTTMTLMNLAKYPQEIREDQLESLIG